MPLYQHSSLFLDLNNFQGQLASVFTSIIDAYKPVFGADFNIWGNDQAEGGAVIVTTKNSTNMRSSVRDHLINTAATLPRNQITFQTENMVTKLLFCRTDGGAVRAYGVESISGAGLLPVSPKFTGKYSEGRRIRSFYARNEIIVSAGVFQTPQLLMVSALELLLLTDRLTSKNVLHSFQALEM